MSAELPEHPPFLYGTAWKGDGTRRLTQMALKQGFRGIDTANQRKHYLEAAVGEGIAEAMDQGLVTREDILSRPSSPIFAGRTSDCRMTQRRR